MNAGLAPLEALMVGEVAPGAGPLFIIGAPRSGTTLAYQVIAQQLRVGYFTSGANYLYRAPSLLTRILKPLLGRPAPVFESDLGSAPGLLAPAENGNFWFRWFPRDGDAGHYLDPGKVRRDDYEDMRFAVGSLERILARPLVFKSVYLSMTAGALARIFEHARFLFVRRDRFFTCQSLLLARQSRRCPAEWWSVRIPGYRELLHRPVWEQVVEQVCRTEAIVHADLSRFAPDRHRVVQYEELCLRPAAVVSGLARWLVSAGYQEYADVRIPPAFEYSNRTRLADDQARLIRERLALIGDDTA
jgi:hypothetical protein